MSERARCFNCGRELDDAMLPVARHTTCPDCHHELHCCVMCRHYRPTATPPCDEDRVDDVPTVKDNANFCEWFRLAGNGGQADSGDDPKRALDALFGDADDADAKRPADAAERALEDLFKRDDG